MCNLSQIILEEGKLRGRVKAYYDMGLSVTEIIETCDITKEKVLEIIHSTDNGNPKVF